MLLSLCFGWEADTVVVLSTAGVPIIELATRAKTGLILLLVEPEEGDYEGWYQKMFREAVLQKILVYFRNIWSTSFKPNRNYS